MFVLCAKTNDCQKPTPYHAKFKRYLHAGLCGRDSLPDYLKDRA
jgi:hypothetical protein